MRPFAALLLGLLVLSAAPGGHADENHVTVYSNDLALIRQVRKIQITDTKQLVTFSDVAAELIPTSVHLSPHDGGPIAVLEQNFEYDLVSAAKILDKYLGEPITIVRKNGELITGSLLGRGDALVIETADGIKLLNWNNELTLALGGLPQGFYTRPTLIWHLSGAKPGRHSMAVSYLTRGMNWQAEYIGIVSQNADRMNLKAWASVDNHCGATFADAVLKLVAGDIHQAPEPRELMAAAVPRAKATAGVQRFEERSFFEYHVYELDRPTTLKNNQVKQVMLLPERRIACSKSYVYRPRQDAKDVSVQIGFENSDQAGLGDPLPAGVVRIYQAGRHGLEFTGEDRIGHTPRNEKVEITLGSAFELSGDRRVVDYQKISERAEKETVEIELRNGKPEESVAIRVEERLRHRDWQLLQSTHPSTGKDNQTLVFEIPVQAGDKTSLRYTVRYRW